MNIKKYYEEFYKNITLVEFNWDILSIFKMPGKNKSTINNIFNNFSNTTA